ncbi:hypothetical protein [Glycomyces sp. MUSA5-2]|uniref:hypothetical protein n=1 Tax=Glycomyces sp. MUSA5-2 TaxID=2053002 RepID=UPI003009FE7E
MHRFAKLCIAAAAAGLGLSACNATGGATDDGSDAAEDPVYTAMSAWNACEVLDDLQPITNEMGIVGWGSITAEGGSPGNSEIGNTFDPEAIGCNGMLNLGDNEGLGAGGEIEVKIIPTESPEAAAAVFASRVSGAEGDAAEWGGAESQEFGDRWDQGTLLSWTDGAEQPNTQVIAQDGQWVLHIDLYHSTDFGIRNGNEPALAFTEDELHQWFIDTYLPSVHQTVNDTIAEAQ